MVINVNYYASAQEAVKKKEDVEVEEDNEEVQVLGLVAEMNPRPRKTPALDGEVVLLETSSESGVVKDRLAKKLYIIFLRL